MSRAYVKNKTNYSLHNHPPPSEDLPMVITNRKDDNLIRKVQYGPRKGRLLQFNYVDDNPQEFRNFILHHFRLIKNSIQVGHI